MTVHERVGMPMDEFIRAYDQAPFELLDGEQLPIMPTVAEHGEIIKFLCALLLAYEQAHKTITVLWEMPYVLAYIPDWVSGALVPDIMIYRADRMAAYRADTPDWRKKPYVLVPDLCIEVVSENDLYTQVDTKVARFLADGVGTAWVFNPRRQVVNVHRAGSNQILELTGDAALDGGELLPGFALTVGAAFGE